MLEDEIMKKKLQKRIKKDKGEKTLTRRIKKFNGRV